VTLPEDLGELSTDVLGHPARVDWTVLHPSVFPCVTVGQRALVPPVPL